ncbi:ABC transporter, solute-binding protein [Pyramidobacter piscolens W5455]|uniref:ABC transporter, solute-binding protein n=2 Tax=Pyramidobacter piscolens TaxID=638849 RepID=A0ABP2HWS7_9BACT|nr:ABC transporter, solute-binding protein [Pyramidobacter piscolens W5455]
MFAFHLASHLNYFGKDVSVMKKFAALVLLLGLTALPASAAEINAYSIMPEKYVSKVTQAFEQETGIHVNFLRLSSGEAKTRLEAEKNNPQVDVLIGGPADTYEAIVAQGVFEKYSPKGVEAIPAKFRSADGYWTGIGIIPLCFLTNEDFLKKNEMQAPATWNDLLDPRYKNGLQMADARTSGTATERIFSLVKIMGEDEAFKYQKKLHANIQMYTKSGAGGAMPIATGQCASGIFYIVDALDIQQQGYPVTISYPKDGVSYGIEGCGVVHGAKNLEDAKKFADWMVSKSFADFIVANKINYVPTRTDVTTDNPLLDLNAINLVETDVAWKGAKRDEFVERWKNEVIK